MHKFKEKSPSIFVDADACPVKKEIYRVSERFSFKIIIVSNKPQKIPNRPSVELKIVGNEPDAADDWIADNINVNDIAVTADIPLAKRCIDKKAFVTTPRGREMDNKSIGSALASRNLADILRNEGMETGGPPPINRKTKSAFLQTFDLICRKAEKNSLGSNSLGSHLL